MIPDQIILFVVMLLLSYVFGNRLVPQLAVVILAFVEIISAVTSTTSDPITAYYAFLFVINIIYSVASTVLKNED